MKTFPDGLRRGAMRFVLFSVCLIAYGFPIWNGAGQNSDASATSSVPAKYLDIIERTKGARTDFSDVINRTAQITNRSQSRLATSAPTIRTTSPGAVAGPVTPRTESRKENALDGFKNSSHGASLPLHEAIKGGKVTVRINGLGGSTGDAIEIAVKSRVQERMSLTLVPGTVFKCDSGRAQDMAGARIKGERFTPTMYRPSAVIELSDTAEHIYVVEAYCMDFHKDNPKESDTFSISPPEQKIALLLSFGTLLSADPKVIQAALWMQRDKVDAVQLRSRFSLTDQDMTQANLLLDSLALNLGQLAREGTALPFAPGSTDIRAAEGGFLLRGGSFPQAFLNIKSGVSRGLNISDGSKLNLKNSPRNQDITIGASGFKPSSLTLDRGSFVTFVIRNKSKDAHRFGSRFFGPKSVFVLEGDDITVPPPVDAFPNVFVKSRSSINIAADNFYDHFFIEVKPGKTVQLTYEAPEAVVDASFDIICGRVGHSEKLQVSFKSDTKASEVPPDNAPTGPGGLISFKGDLHLFYDNVLAWNRSVGSPTNQRHIWNRSRGLGKTCNVALATDGKFTKISALSGCQMAFKGQKPDSDTFVLDAPGSHDIRIKSDSDTEKPVPYAGLLFRTSCVMGILLDGTVVTDRKGIVVQDSDGKSWTSKEVKVGGETVNAFFAK